MLPKTFTRKNQAARTRKQHSMTPSLAGHGPFDTEEVPSGGWVLEVGGPHQIQRFRFSQINRRVITNSNSRQMVTSQRSVKHSGHVRKRVWFLQGVLGKIPQRKGISPQARLWRFRWYPRVYTYIGGGLNCGNASHCHNRTRDLESQKPTYQSPKELVLTIIWKRMPRNLWHNQQSFTFKL